MIGILSIWLVCEVYDSTLPSQNYDIVKYFALSKAPLNNPPSKSEPILKIYFISIFLKDPKHYLPRKERLNRVEQIDGCLEPTIRGSSMPVTVTGRSAKFRRYPRPNDVSGANKKGGAASGGMSHLLLGWPLHDK
ncbi:hypothetical protein CDAR_609341 [Caerostris darwini]|uniref:Uncharacterized protein n=1 Tax=Caerostris darwini TaxID=1538125 RepID=A0AAV4UNV8_9ARAC|nr:hypothetical protein CDAR_609341 [Caerostris darwini]